MHAAHAHRACWWSCCSIACLRRQATENAHTPVTAARMHEYVFGACERESDRPVQMQKNKINIYMHRQRARATDEINKKKRTHQPPHAHHPIKWPTSVLETLRSSGIIIIIWLIHCVPFCPILHRAAACSNHATVRRCRRPACVRRCRDRTILSAT